MACVVAANGNGFGLYLLHFGVCDVCPGHLQAWTNCAWQVEIHFLHQREMWRRVSITGLYSHLWHSTVLLLSVLVRDAVCLSRFNLQPAKDSLTLLCFFGNHTLTTIVVRLCRWGMSSGGNLFLWLMLRAWVFLKPMKGMGGHKNWRSFYFFKENLFSHKHFAVSYKKHSDISCLKKDFEVLLRRKMDSSAALWGRRREKDKKCLMWGALGVFNMQILSSRLC